MIKPTNEERLQKNNSIYTIYLSLDFFHILGIDLLEEALRSKISDLCEIMEFHKAGNRSYDQIQFNIDMLNDIYLVVQKYKNKIENKELLS